MHGVRGLLVLDPTFWVVYLPPLLLSLFYALRLHFALPAPACCATMCSTLFRALWQPGVPYSALRLAFQFGRDHYENLIKDWAVLGLMGEVRKSTAPFARLYPFLSRTARLAPWPCASCSGQTG